MCNGVPPVCWHSRWAARSGRRPAPDSSASTATSSGPKPPRSSRDPRSPTTRINPAGSRAISPGQARMRHRTGCERNRRAAKVSAFNDSSSPQCASSTTTISGRSADSSASIPSSAEPAGSRSGWPVSSSASRGPAAVPGPSGRVAPEAPRTATSRRGHRTPLARRRRSRPGNAGPEPSCRCPGLPRRALPGRGRQPRWPAARSAAPVRGPSR